MPLMTGVSAEVVVPQGSMVKGTASRIILKTLVDGSKGEGEDRDSGWGQWSRIILWFEIQRLREEERKESTSSGGLASPILTYYVTQYPT